MTVVDLRSARGGRKLDTWIGGFLEYTEQLWSTEEFRRWAGIVALAGVLERKVWIRSQGSNIFPNLYVFLVGPPASGKTRAVEMCDELWKQVPDVKISPVSVTKASLMDELALAVRTEPELGEKLSPYNSLLIASKELGALIPTYDPDFLNALTYIYDNQKYDEKRRGSKEYIIIERPQINLIGCTTPSFLLDTLPNTAWDQGFLSRVIIIYKDFVGEREWDLSEEGPPRNKALFEALCHDIQLIAKRKGQLTIAADAKESLVKWVANKEELPTHPRLQYYVTRRPIHTIKLAMIAAIDKDHYEVTLEDVNTAINWMLAAEKEMPDLFMKFQTGGDANVISDCLQYALNFSQRAEGKQIPSHLIWQYLSNKVPSYRVQAVLDTMIRSGMLIGNTTSGVTLFTPRLKNPNH